VNTSIPERLAAVATAVATAFLLLAVAIVPFLTPAWVSFEQGRAEAAAWTGFTPAELSLATDSILHDLVLGPPDFAASVQGQPVLSERERSHMRDVRAVFTVFAGLAVAAAVGLTLLVAGARRLGHPERAWAAVAAGAKWLIAGIVVAAVVVTFAFDQAFELVHTLFFPAGSFDFDPRTDRLVQLFPFQFWFETTLAVGVVVIGLAALTWLVARERARGAASAARPVIATPAARPETDPAR
jgi:integral membrane protein (TIGR01906 family)